MTGPLLWTVAHVEDDGPWEIRRDGALIDTVRAGYEAVEVLSYAEARAGGHVIWRLDGNGGFIGQLEQL